MKFLRYSLFLVISIITISIFAIHFNFFSIKDGLYDKYPNLNIRKYIFSQDPVFNKLHNDYNVKFIPFTEFLKLDLKKKKIYFKEDYYSKNAKEKSISYGKYGSFYLDLYKDQIIITDYLGNNYISKLNSLLDADKDISTKIIKNNIKNIERVYDALVDKDQIFLSYVKKENDCKKIVVSSAKINMSEINYKEIFKSNSCHDNASPGRMVSFNLENQKGLILTISSGSYNSPSMESQDSSSIYGKTIFINLKNEEYKVFSSGHRVVQGLVSHKSMLIATEHGPRGGDEINLIKQGKNYGWPISSFGEKYDFKYEKTPVYKKSHSDFGFEEPIFSYIPGIGISEIIKMPESYSEMLPNVFIVSSLYGKSIYFVRFNNQFNKILFSEKIFLNERIRDLKYEKTNELILLAFEENGEIGIIRKIN